MSAKFGNYKYISIAQTDILITKGKMLNKTMTYAVTAVFANLFLHQKLSLQSIDWLMQIV